MRQGDTGRNVQLLQEALYNIGYHGIGAIDGNFGAKTDAGVRYFQACNGLHVSGEVDHATAAALGLDLNAHEHSGLPHVQIHDVSYQYGRFAYTVVNHGAHGMGVDYVQFRGAHDLVDSHSRVYAQGQQVFEVEFPHVSGHYTVTVHVNVTDQNREGDDHRELQADHTVHA